MGEEMSGKIIDLRNTGFPLTKRDKGLCRCKVIGERYPFGLTPNVWVDEHHRNLECRDCGAVIEAFDYLWVIAVEGGSLCTRLANLREEKQAMEAQLKMLNEQIRDARTEAKRTQRGNKLSVRDGD